MNVFLTADFMSASQAANQTNEYHISQSTALMNLIMAKIAYASCRGQSSTATQIPMGLRELFETALTDCGYKIENSSFGAGNVIISWVR